MATSWTLIAQRAIDGLEVAPGELVLIRDHTGRADVLREMVLAVEQRGATPLPEIATADLLGRLMRAAPAAHLATWDRHRLAWMQQADRVLVLQGEPLGLDLAGAPADAVAAWSAAVDRLTAIEEERGLPFLLVAVPTDRHAALLGIPLPELEAVVLPALAVRPEAMQERIAQTMRAANHQTLTIHSGAGCELRLDRGDRQWLADDGRITADDRARGAVVSNLPAGSIYTTVLERETSGTMHLPRAADAIDVTLRFAAGAITDISAAQGAAELRAMFDSHSGAARRVAHIGIGLNPELHHCIGWPLVDEHVGGCLFIAFGENRYMGGQNASSLNVDFVVPRATLLAGDRFIVREGDFAIATKSD